MDKDVIEKVCGLLKMFSFLIVKVEKNRVLGVLLVVLWRN